MRSREKYDFSGWATRNDLRCSDGRTIRRDAFIEDDGHIVPLVWNHQHNEPYNVLGHALLENRPEGVYTYCKFNDSPSGRQAKELVKHGDITALSIYANKLKQRGGDVLHGAIREVSLVYTPANPGAYIEMANIAHGDELADMDDGEATIYMGDNLFVYDDYVEHAYDDEYDEDYDVGYDDEDYYDDEYDDDYDEYDDDYDEDEYYDDEVEHAYSEDDEYYDDDYDEDDEYYDDDYDEDDGYYDDDYDEDYDEDEYYDDEVEHAYSEDDEYDDYADDSEEDEPMARGNMTIKDVFDTFTEEQKQVAYFLIAKAMENGGEVSDEDFDDDDDEMSHADYDDDEPTVQDIYDSLNADQKKVLHYLIGKAAQAARGEDDEDEDEDEYDEDEYDEDDMQHSYYGGSTFMKQNAFDNYYDGGAYGMDTLTHSEMETIIDDGARLGSMKESFLQHADEFGITNIEYLFPDARNINERPDFIQRDMSWVQKVMGSTRHTPFSRIKSIHADITEDSARALGYIKGKLKKEEVFKLLKRTTDPQTILKKQKLDRDDIIDITDFDVVSWIKTEMRTMLDEEIARAILIGDGRSAYDEYKISDLHIRPIWTDAELYTINAVVELKSDDTDNIKAKKFIRAAIKARKNYKGSGQPTLFTTEDMLTDMLLIEDELGRSMYEDEAALARKLRVKEIVTVPVMENQTREVDNTNRVLDGIIVNMADYNVGADKGGAINMFDDFDIDYNQQKYLIETRCSGALVKPFSAIVVEHTVTA
jgi:HK97 family phage prohead protease